MKWTITVGVYMVYRGLHKLILLLLLIRSMLFSAFNLPKEELQRAGAKIWQNECGATVEGLTSWNRGEEFASLGIGHFIWYPEGKSYPFDEQFPKLLSFFKERGVALPRWLSAAEGAPWSSRDHFLSEFHGEKLRELRSLLLATIEQQTLFMSRRLEESLPKILEQTRSEEERKRVERNFYSILNAPKGLYALLDYINFKGEGISPSERYNGKGWGLLQVLLEMEEKGFGALEEFAAAAKNVLSRRVQNSPKERGEERYLKGWHKRVDSYP